MNSYVIKVPSDTVVVTLQFLMNNLFKLKIFKNLRIGKKMHKITNNSILNRGSTLNLTNLVGVHPRNTHTKFEANRYKRSHEWDIIYSHNYPEAY